MKNSSPMVQRLCSRWRTQIPHFAIVRAIDAVFHDLDVWQIPVNPYALAARRRAEIIPTKMTADGIISRAVDGGYVIQLNSQQPEQRSRFTVAHEVGHTFFFELEDEPSFRYRVEDSAIEAIRSDPNEEYICNIAAAELIMPFSQFSARMEQLPVSASSILQLCREFNTSIQATARRVVQLSKYRILVCLWRFNSISRSYVTAWIARPNGYRIAADQAFSIGVGDPMFKTFDRQPNFRGRKWISLGGPMDDYFVDGMALAVGEKKDILTMFILERYAERLADKRGSKVIPKQQLRLF